MTIPKRLKSTLVLLGATIAIIIGSPMARAYDLKINNETTIDLEGATIGFDGSSFILTAPNYTASSEPVDPVDPVDPVEPIDPSVTVGERIPSSTMATTVRYDKVIWVPADQRILAQAFTTIDSPTSYGNFIYHIVPGNSYNPPLNFWVSVLPGGEAISPKCHYSRGRDVSTLVWTHFPSNRCVLEPNTSYYLNVQSDVPGPRSKIDRWVRVLRL